MSKDELIYRDGCRVIAAIKRLPIDEAHRVDAEAIQDYTEVLDRLGKDPRSVTEKELKFHRDNTGFSRVMRDLKIS